MAMTKGLLKQIGMTGLLLMTFAVVGSGLLSFTFEGTKNKIAENERNALLQRLQELVPDDRYDNDLIADTIQVQSARLGVDQPITVYRARLAEKPVGAVFNSIAPDGYNGEIRLLVAINVDGVLSGVRVVTHKETPGLGDAIDAAKSDWVLDFAGKSLQNPQLGQWKVKKDLGVFDQLTGATITPRALVKAVKLTLEYYAAHQSSVFAPTEKSNE